MMITIAHARAVVLGGLLLSACGDRGPRVAVDEAPVEVDWAQIVERDTLRVLTEFNSTSTFVYRGETMGFEYELLRAFAEAHDLELGLVVLDDREQMINRLNRGEGDLAAGRLAPARIEAEHILFTEHLYQTQPTVVQRTGEAPGVPGVVEEMLDSLPPHLQGGPASEAPAEIRARRVESPADLGGREVAITGEPAFYELLVELEDTITGDIEVVELEPGVRTEGLLRRIADGRLELGVAPENLAALSGEYYDNVSVRPTLGGPYGIAWAVRETSPELLNRLNEWLMSPAGQSSRESLYQKYYVDRLGYRERGVSGYLSSETGRISQYDELLQQGARTLGWDWRLLAAQTFQESRFDPNARSWAGAMGLLQLMPGTAREVGVTDPYDPAQNVRGGVQYLQWLAGQWAPDIPDAEERLKFVLASYNTGRGHVQDAQRLTVKNGGNPQVWEDVAFWLLRKSQRAVYTDPVVRYGFSRGLEPVTYVAKILDRFENYSEMVVTREADGT
jgi:membrane-bound lytic murein transglycosylase F